MATDYTTIQEQMDRYSYCRDEGGLKYQKKARLCEDFFAGDQWDEETKNKLALVRRPALTLNKTLPSLMVMFAEQLKNRASVNFVPKQQGTQSTANALNKLWIHTATSNKLKWVESQVFDDGIITGRGFYDVRMNFDEHVLGNVSIQHINPMNVLIDPDAEEYDPDKWNDVFYSKWLSPDEIGRIYGVEKGKAVKQFNYDTYPMGYDYFDVRPDTFGGTEDIRTQENYLSTSEEYRKRLRVIERQYKVRQNQEHFIDLESGDLSVVPAGMPKEKIQAILSEFEVDIIKRPVDVYKWTVTCGDVVLHNEESPYKHFTILPFFPIFRRGATIGMVENMIDPQQLYNKSRSQELHVINTSANSGWKVKKGAVLNMTTEELEQRGAETGLVVELTDVNDLEKITPNQIPTGLDRVSQIAGEDIKEISMASDSMRGFDREDVAAKAIQAKQQVGGKNFAKIMDNLAHTRTLLAGRVLDLWQTFYTTERQFQITGESLRAESEQLVINQPQEQMPGPGAPQQEQGAPPGILNDITVGRYDVTVTTIPDRDTMQQTQLEQAIQLKELGVPIPDRMLIQNSTLEDKEELIDELYNNPDPAQEQMRQAEAQEKVLANDKTAAETEEIKSTTVLNLVRAGRDSAETDVKANEAAAGPEQQSGAGQGPDPMEAEIKARDMDLREREFADSSAFKRDELNLKRADSAAKTMLEMKKLDQAKEAAKAAPKAATTQKR